MLALLALFFFFVFVKFMHEIVHDYLLFKSVISRYLHGLSLNIKIYSPEVSNFQRHKASLNITHIGWINFDIQWKSKQYLLYYTFLQKQPPRGVFRKRFSENMQQIYRRAPMPKCNFKKVAKQFYWNFTSAWMFSCKFDDHFQNTPL